ncbi:MAG: class I SAM-dependent methyltransferase, partial [Chloroflexi bacterium]|nr:class I SAM-dependent methyltransferase [Chloroflexota bacterium]
MKRRYKNSDSAIYTDHLQEFYTRAKTPHLEVYGDAYQALRSAIVGLAEPTAQDVIVDLATGGGYQAAEFQKSGYCAYGFDYVYDRALLSQEQHMPKCLHWGVADISQLPFSSKSIDIVTVSLALHDLPADVLTRALREINRVTRKRVILLEPQAPCNYILQRLYVAIAEIVDESTHIAEFLAHDFEAMLNNARLEIQHRQKCLYNVLTMYSCVP